MQPATTGSNPFAAFVAQAAEGRNSLPRILIGTAIVLAVWFAGTLGLLSAGAYLLAIGWWPEGWVASTGRPFFDFPASRIGLATAVLTLGAIWPGVWLAVRLLHRRRLATLFGWAARISRSDFVRAMLATTVVAVLISLLTLATEPRVERTDLAPATWLLALPALALVLLIQTSSEEILFRGYLLQSLAQRFRSPWIWAALPAAAFAAAHWFPAAAPWMNAMVILSIFLFAMAASLLVWLTGNLGAAMGMHFANNLVAFLFVSAGAPDEALSLWVTPAIEDPTWTVADALISGAIQVAMIALVLALLVWRRSPFRVGVKSEAPAPMAAAVD